METQIIKLKLNLTGRSLASNNGLSFRKNKENNMFQRVLHDFVMIANCQHNPEMLVGFWDVQGVLVKTRYRKH